ncbi:SMP-30/gluconolactonase/LRE family protein [Acidiferrimicrobium sp. IK]|uniref:SMP-30/gluconolactonase/LRE family protein n=1 Tax=Acidiferrimicrobium sp. IK TaxID=2871700 RepID=UPI0021CB4455|nr:SMP-30/gluconolactonase/LRE family protein [Acidiferrimicrobium sp. IK]MCU4186864.1 SMP-30/gluconolactonase/LRE family protein [Acidiferrimicrobium sp. IK]
MAPAGGGYLSDAHVVAEGLAFPEGPVALLDGSVLVVEMQRGTLTKVRPDGRTEVVAEPGGGPNGAAIGPDGAAWLCNNGGFPSTGKGRIERVDLARGSVEVVLTDAGGEPLRAPNDIVFDRTGGFWFTDYGAHGRRRSVPGGIYYVPAGADQAEAVVECGQAEPVARGSAVRAFEMCFPVAAPNGIGLSPDGTRLYWSETETRSVQQRRLSGPGVLAPSAGNTVATVLRGQPLDTEQLLVGLPGNRLLDSLALDAEGYVAVGTLLDSGITVVAPDGTWELARLPAACADRMVTNICFGGPDRRTAWVTLSETGRLVSATWPRPGLALAFDA